MGSRIATCLADYDDVIAKCLRAWALVPEVAVGVTSDQVPLQARQPTLAPIFTISLQNIAAKRQAGRSGALHAGGRRSRIHSGRRRHPAFASEASR